MKIAQAISLLILFLFSGFGVYAYSSQDLYTGKVEVASEQDADRERAIQQAFAQVLVKLSGQSQTAQQFGFAKEPKRASVWVQQYQYEESIDPEGQQKTYLVASFDKEAINNYLKKSKVSLWGGDRPLTLVWMAVEENGVQAIVSESEEGLKSWQQWFAIEAQARLVPVLFPVLDLTDKQSVAISDVWYHVSDVLQNAANRYQAQNVLSGRIYKNLQTNMWSADWSLSAGGQKIVWQQAAQTPEHLMRASVDRFADELAKLTQNTQEATSQASYVLRVDNIKDLPAYVRVMTYLQTLEAVDTISPTQVTPNSVTFQLSLKTPLPLFQQKLIQDNVLSALPKASDDEALYYQYL